VSLLLYALYWVSFTALFAAMQGLLIPSLRNTTPGKNANIHDFALHKIGFVAWLLPVLLLPSWLHIAIALLVRVVVFDFAVNYAAGDKLFKVGQTAKTDKLLHWIAGKLRISAPALSASLKALVFLFLCAVLLKTC
jgi:hypothetical protein